jgi:hypothetical protein
MERNGAAAADGEAATPMDNETLDEVLTLLSVDDCTPEWHLLRGVRITASVASVFAGCSEYGTPWAHAVYKAMAIQGPWAGNKATKHGQAHEATCLAGFERATGNVVCAAPYRSDWLTPWTGGTPDALVVRDCLSARGAPALVEAKCPFYLMYKTPPLAYVFQTHVQMHAYRIPMAYLPAWKGGRITVWRIHYSEHLYAYFMLFAMRYRACLQSGVLPDHYVMHMLPHAAKAFAATGFDEAKRDSIARAHDVEPHALPPGPVIDLICTDLDVGGKAAPTVREARTTLRAATV